MVEANDAFEAHHPQFSAYQRVGLNLAPVVPDYDPEPDVAVISADERGDERYSDRFYLAAEVISASDQKSVESKCDVYKSHPNCRCVLVVQQNRVEVSVALWTESGWTERRLSDPGEQLILEDFGLHCALADLYRGTALQPRGKQ